MKNDVVKNVTYNELFKKVNGIQAVDISNLVLKTVKMEGNINTNLIIFDWLLFRDTLVGTTF